MRDAAALPPGLARGAPAAALLLAVAVAVLVGSSAAGIHYAAGADEGHYLAYARVLAERGPGVLPELFRAYVDDAERRFYPNPLRLGFLVPAGLWTALRGARFEALSELSLLSHFLAILAAYGFGRRLFGDPRALFAAALFGFAPLGMGLARRALMDSAATLTLLLAVWAFWEMLRRPGSARQRLLFMLAFGGAVLVKETGVLLLIPFAVLLALEARRASLPPCALGAALVAPLAVCAALWVLAAGGPGTLLRVVETILSSPSTNPYANLVGGGPWYRYVLDFLLLSPWPTLLAVGACIQLALPGERDPGRVLLAVWIAGLLLGFGFFTKNVRYVAVLDFPIRALAVCVLWDLLRGWRAAGAAACALVVALLCAFDAWSFWTLFVSGGIYDPASLYLLSIRGIVPTR